MTKCIHSLLVRKRGSLVEIDTFELCTARRLQAVCLQAILSPNCEISSHAFIGRALVVMNQVLAPLS